MTKLDPDIPIEKRPLHVVNLPHDDYLKLTTAELEEFLSPLFPKTRPSNNAKIETLKPKKHVAEQYDLPGIKGGATNNKAVADLLARAAALVKK